MIDGMKSLESNSTWTLDLHPTRKSSVGYRWVLTVKVGLKGRVDRLKALLVVKRYTQIYDWDYGDTFSPIAKMESVQLFLFKAAIHR